MRECTLRIDSAFGHDGGTAAGGIDLLPTKTNTTIGCIITNAALQKAEAGKLASMTRAAYARCIRPVGTLADGDTIYAASVGKVPADLSILGAFSSKVMEEAICCAVRRASVSESEYLREIQ